MCSVLIINGPNLNVLGIREPGIYGEMSYENLSKILMDYAKQWNIQLEIYQSNSEGEIVDKIQKARGVFSSIIINAGALTHYSYSIYDALKYTDLPVIEVHISNIFKREDFRKKSVISPIANGVISGLGVSGYKYALEYCKYFKR